MIKLCTEIRYLIVYLKCKKNRDRDESMLFKVTYKKVWPWIIESIFYFCMLIYGVIFIVSFFDRNNLEPGFGSMKEAIIMLVVGILLLVLSIGLFITSYRTSKDVLEVYPDHFCLKQKGRRDWIVYLSDVTLKYEFEYENGGGGLSDDISVYCLKQNLFPVQVFSNKFTNIKKLCEFCIENNVPATYPATWEKCRKHLEHSIFS